MSGSILVTGANGLVGFALARRLAAEGHAVVGMDLVAAKDAPFPAIAADINDVHALYRVLKAHGVETIVHFGGISGPMVANDRPHHVFTVNVQGTMTLCAAAAGFGVRRVVFASSRAAYGPQPVDRPVTEAAPLNAYDPYGASKVAGEAIMRGYVAGGRFEGTSLRLGTVYGPRRATDCLVRDMLTDALKGVPTRLPHGGDAMREYIHVDDIVEGVVRALFAETLPRHAYNIGPGGHRTLREIADIVRQVLPAADIEIGSGPFPGEDAKGPIACEAAAADLGFAARIGLAEGFAAYAAWLKPQAAVA